MGRTRSSCRKCVIKDGKETTVDASRKLPFQEHGLPESFLDVAMNFGYPARARLRRELRRRPVTCSFAKG